MTRVPKWRTFEELVAGLEHCLAPRGAEVTSPAKLPDLKTGSLREVDALIRYPAGVGEGLVTVECRDRTSVQDVMWIEQLAKKKERLGIARTVAVSARGFSAEARRVAEDEGVDVRVLADITEDEVTQDWLKGFSVGLVVTDYTVPGFTVELRDGTVPELEDLPEELFGDAGMHLPFIRISSPDAWLTFDALAAAVGDRDVPTDGTPVTKHATLTFGPQAAWLPTRHGEKEVAALHAAVEFTKRELSAGPLRVHQYRAEGATLLEVARGSAAIGEARYEMTVQFSRRPPT